MGVMCLAAAWRYQPLRFQVLQSPVVVVHLTLCKVRSALPASHVLTPFSCSLQPRSRLHCAHRSPVSTSTFSPSISRFLLISIGARSLPLPLALIATCTALLSLSLLLLPLLTGILD